MASSKQLHAVAIPLPWPAQGHITPMMRFCKRLASREGFTITFVEIQPFYTSEAAHANSEELSNKQQELRSSSSTSNSNIAAASPAQQRRDIRRVHIPMEIRQDGSSVFESFLQALQSLAPLIEELLSTLIHQEPPITCLISDLFMTGPTQKLADQFGIPRIALHTTNQSTLLFKNYILEGTISLEQVLEVLSRKEGLKEGTFMEGLPGLPTLRNEDIMDYQEDSLFIYEVNLQILGESKGRAHAIVVNSSEELEGTGLKVKIGGTPIYGVGPLIEPLDNKDTSISYWKEDKDCMLWLNEQPFLSVLYISFGSVATLSKAQFEEIVAGLISSQQRFLWAFRSDLVKDACYSTFPLDLLSKSHGKGYSVQWAPQLSVLSHPSVGGFLTHCGWNSTIEAISLSVPMLCFPSVADQFINAKFITQEWKVGLGFKRSKESGLVERDEVERGIQTLMVEEEGKLLRKNANYFKDLIHKSLEPEGTSSKNIQALIHSLR